MYYLKNIDYMQIYSEEHNCYVNEKLSIIEIDMTS